MLKLFESPIIYVTRDIERALGIPVTTPEYFIISNATPFAKRVKNNFDTVLLLDQDTPLDTHELITNSQVQQTINSHMPVSLLVFKNTKQIEMICVKNGWHLLNPKAALGAQVEEKISQVEWLGALEKFLPPHRIETCKNIVWTKTPFVLQFNRAHTGSGTFLIKSGRQLKTFQTKFPDRPVRLTEYIPGPMFTSNNVVTPKGVTVGNINYQITGLSPFTDNPFATIGNDWALPHQILSKSQKSEYIKIAHAVGEKLQKDGWLGLFGIDVVADQKTGKLYLIEINARQPASTTYESHLQARTKYLKPDKKLLTTFEAHLASLQGLNISKYSLAPIDHGAQIIIRNPSKEGSLSEKKVEKWKNLLTEKGFNCIEYDNKNPGADRLRIQSEIGIMLSHGQLNEHGEKIVECLR